MIASEGRGNFGPASIHHHMLLILIPTAWLALLILLVCVCRIAADADAKPSSLQAMRSASIREQPAPSLRLSARARHGARRRAHSPHLHGARSRVRGRRVTAQHLR